MTGTRALPAGFLVGAASAAHQIEGGNVNSDLWAAEWAPGSVFAEPSGDACDSYHRYAEDVGLLADAGLTAYRFSVEWARVEPEEGYFSRAALDQYRRMVSNCVDRGVTPILTYQHFTAPRWFAQRGGWAAEGAADLFARYCEKVTAHLGDLIPAACTINEANLLSTFLNVELLPAAHRDQLAGSTDPEGALKLFAASGFPLPDVEAMAAVHRKAVEAIKSGPGEIEVGWTLALIDLQAEPGGEERRDRARQASQTDWIEACAGDDFVGVQTYTRETFGAEGRAPVPEGSATMQTGWEVYPEALENAIRLTAETARVPILVSENGIATDDDDARIAYTTRALEGVLRCLEDGIDVRGYLHWSLLDNFEWVSGYAMTFGLVAVDRATFTRAPKPSLAWLGEVARSRSVSG